MVALKSPLPVLLLASFLLTPAQAQTPSATFDVVSIKPSNRTPNEGGFWGINDNRYKAINTPLIYIILAAYLERFGSSKERLINAPDWVTTEPYDIVAKGDEATAQSWKGLRQAQQVAAAAPLLRAMLEDRCKLVTHTVPTEIPGYEVTISKRGSKLKETPPGDPPPTGAFTFEGGWKLIYPQPGDARPSLTFINITMADLLQFLSLGRSPIVDRTGLQAHYNFVLPKLEVNPTPPGEEPQPPPDAAHMFDWAAIGLEIKPVKVPALNLVVDHIERPTPN